MAGRKEITTAFTAKLKRVAETVGLVCFVLLALCGMIALLRGDLMRAVHAQTDQPASTSLGTAAVEASTAASVALPSVVHYQGDLRDNAGQLLEGTYMLTFQIYDTPVGGGTLWYETHSNVPVRAGHFSVLLGDATPLPATLFSGPNRYIGFTVGSDAEMIPRQRFSVVPYAFWAGGADQLDGKDSSAFSAADHAHSTLNASDGTPSNALAIDDKGFVGISTTSPQAKLEVADGNIRFSGTVLQTGIQHMTTGLWNLTSQIMFDDINDDGANSRVQMYFRNAGNDFREVFRTGADGAGNYVSAFPVGNVGIGTTNPLAPLDVRGAIRALAIESATFTGWGNGCHNTNIYGLVYGVQWDPGGQGSEGTDMSVYSGLGRLTDSSNGGAGNHWVGPAPIQVCVSGGKAYVDSISIFYIPFTGYQ